MMAPAARPPTMPSPRPQPRQPAWASVGMETAASANTPAAAIAVIVVFMFLPRQEMIALRSSGCTQVFVTTPMIPPTCWIEPENSDAPTADAPTRRPQAVVRPRSCAYSGEPAGIDATQFTQPSQFVRSLLNAL